MAYKIIIMDNLGKNLPAFKRFVVNFLMIGTQV